MNIKIYLDRYTETCCVPGTQFEQNATVIKFDFSELDFIDDECIKTIHFFHDSLEEANYIGDSIIQNDEFKIPKSITEYENVLAFIQITKSDFIWKTKSFDLHFNQSLDVDKTLDEDELGILQELILEVKEIQNITTDKFEEAAEKATEDFNKNATEKLNDFNDNYTDKLNSFNENSNSKVNNYNSNAESKTEDFNANADNQKSNFDNNVTEKTNTFNSNTESKITEFNSNATSKTDSFNSNATSKETSYNENAIAKLNEYNENHTIKMNAYNDNTTEKITEYNDNAAEKLEEYDEHIEDLDNIVSKNTVNGESILIDDALKYKIFDCKIDGNVEQVTTTGKNLLSKKLNEYSKTTDNITVDEASDNLLKLSVNPESTSYENVQILSIPVEANKTYTLSAKIDGNINSSVRVVKANSGASADNLGSAKNSQPLIFTCDGTYSHIGLFFYVSEGVKPSSNMTASFSNVQLEEGTAATEYEPYTGGEPSPSPDYPQDITVIKDSIKIKQTRKNLFDKNGDFTYGNNNNLTSLQEDGTIKTTANFSNQRSSGQLISVDKNTIYVFSGILLESQSPNNTIIEILNENNTRIYMFEISNSANYKFSFMFNSADNEKIWISLNARDFNLSASVYAIFDKIQIEEGTVSTDYEEYQSNEHTINLQSNELVKLADDTKDTIEIDKNRNVSLNKRIGKIVLDGTENIILDGELSNVYRFICYSVNSLLNYENVVISNYLINERNYTSDKDHFYIGTNNAFLFMKKDLFSSKDNALAELKQMFATNNMIIYSDLIEPTTTSLGQLANFKTYAGINHFFLETNISTNFEIKYAQDLQKVISKQQVEIDELKTLLSSTATSALLLDNYASDLVSEIESEVEQ